MKRFRTRAEEFRLVRNMTLALLLVAAIPIFLQSLLSLRFYSLRNVDASYSTVEALPWGCTSAIDNRHGSWNIGSVKYCYGSALRQFPPRGKLPPRPQEYALTCTGMFLPKLVNRAVMGDSFSSCSHSRSYFKGRVSLIRDELKRGEKVLGRLKLSQIHLNMAVVLDDLAGFEGGNTAIPLLHEALEHLEMSLDLSAHLRIDNADFDQTSLYRDRIAAKLKAWSSETL